MEFTRINRPVGLMTPANAVVRRSLLVVPVRVVCLAGVKDVTQRIGGHGWLPRR